MNGIVTAIGSDGLASIEAAGMKSRFRQTPDLMRIATVSVD